MSAPRLRHARVHFDTGRDIDRLRARIRLGVITAGLAAGLVGSVTPAVAAAEASAFAPDRYAAVEAIRPPFAPTVAPGDWKISPLSRELARPVWRSPLESESERRIRIEAHRPRAAAPSPEKRGAAAAGEEEEEGTAATSLPESRRAEVALESAARFEAALDPEAALYAIERAVALGRDDVSVWRSLARARLLMGDGPGSEAAFLAALEATEAAAEPIAFVELRARIHRELAKLYLLEGRRRDALIALDLAEGLAPVDETVSDWLLRSRFALVLTAPPRPRASAPVWPVSEPAGLRERLARRGSDLYEGLLPASAREFVELRLRGPLRARSVIAAGSALVGLLALLFLLRGRGDLKVVIEYPEELRGVFRVRLSASQGRLKRSPRSARSEILKGGVSTRHEHHLVNRETHFQRLLARRYWIGLEGMLLDPESEEILKDVFERKSVRVRHRRTVRIEFDVRPEQCPVDLRVVWDGQPAAGAAVVARGLPETLKQASGDVVRLFLPKGVHKLVVGCGDRVLEREVDVRSHQPTRLNIDLAGGAVIFKGCPPAVEPYLRGDIETVARALERDGQANRAYLLLAELNRERGNASRAADYFESAGHRLEAAELRAGLHDYLRAASLYMEADNPLSAAEMYRAAGRPVDAGRAFEMALDFDRAIECYRDAGDVNKWIGALERRGETFAAAKVALENDQRPRAMRLLQCIGPEEDDYAESCWLLAGAFEREGHWDLAAQKLEQHISTFRAGLAPADQVSRLAELLEQAGNLERALDVLEDLRRRDPTFPNVAARIEHLRKQRSAAQQLMRTGGRLRPGDAPTAYVAESRYEILEEIGRGGMGVVFRARDRRLDRIVALKQLPEDLLRNHPRALQLFLREAQSAARLNHPNIVTVFDTDQQDGHFFITMELLRGQSFLAILKERGRLSATGTITVGLQVAAGMQYAHAQGIVHRDIKTANLFLTSDKIVKIMDFGLAKMFEEVRGGTTVISGTPFYMSPEQVQGGVVDHRSDLYSLGVTLFELATGRVPFAEGDIAYHHRHTPAPDPREWAPQLPEDLARLLLDLLEKDVALRCASAEEVGARLDRIRV